MKFKFEEDKKITVTDSLESLKSKTNERETYARSPPMRSKSPRGRDCFEPAVLTLRKGWARSRATA